ncbi:hypothetical protein [Flagellimonas sp. S3867]|uniref:hypothetical protein n=1 Tax=Flagellimonas sp. S3867 TaxID=2768063 RepID=UPI001689183E|nr:hypothetical protein [Flagellimonas sp. S3867]
MQELTLNDLQGLWLGNEFNLIVGLNNDSNYGNLVDRLNGTNTETRSLELSDITEGNTKMLIFNNEYEIELWRWSPPQITIVVDGSRYDLTFSPR